MGVQDDFRQWERELDETVEPAGDGTGGRAALVVAAVLLAGCVLLIVLGQAPLGTAVLVISTIIVVLWRAGM
jgi:cell division protein FtsW (lipid II flippase)